MLLPPKYRNGSHKQMKKKRYKISIHWFSSRLMLFSRHLTPLGTRRYAVKASFFFTEFDLNDLSIVPLCDQHFYS